MKYWRGYLTAAILAACTWALREFARGHSALVDMIYPYVTRMAQNFMVDWSGSVDYCMWQVLLLVLLALAVASLVLMVVLKWNFFQWFGWICATVTAVVFLNTAIYGLNEFAGPLAEDVRLEETDYTITELEEAAVYYREQANTLADRVERDGNGDVVFADFDTLAEQAADGFETLVYEESEPVFAGSLAPVKKLGWENRFTARGITGVTVGLTGEAAVNPQTPAVMQPYAMCKEMVRRMCIIIERDANFGAYLSCMANEDLQFQYSGALMGYRHCLNALKTLDETTGAGAAARVAQEENENLRHDMTVCDAFFGDNKTEDEEVSGLLTSWHIQEIVLPSQVVEEEGFDPMDKTQVDLGYQESTDEEDAG